MNDAFTTLVEFVCKGGSFLLIILNKIYDLLGQGWEIKLIFFFVFKYQGLTGKTFENSTLILKFS